MFSLNAALTGVMACALISVIGWVSFQCWTIRAEHARFQPPRSADIVESKPVVEPKPLKHHASGSASSSRAIYMFSFSARCLR